MLQFPPGAKRISSRATVFYKRAFAPLWFGSLGLFLLIGFTAVRSQPRLVLPVMILPLIIGSLGYLLVRMVMSGIVDEVWDNGQELLVVNEGHVEHVPLAGIVNIGYSGWTNPKRATLYLRKPGRWGEKLVFIPVRSSIRILNLNDNEMIDELVKRVDAARRQA